MSTREKWERLVAAVLRREELWQLFHQQSPSICSLASSDDEDFQDSPIERRARGVDDGVEETHREKNRLGNSSPQGLNGSIGENSERKREQAKYRPRAGIVPKAIAGEQVAAGWPAWLSAVAGEAIQGWVPRRADSFEKIDKIGEGNYSNVYLARDVREGKIVALKKVMFDTLDPESVRFMAREILILRRLDHPNVIKLEGLITSRISYSLYLVFEYMEHDLAGLASSQHRLSLTEPQVKCYMKQLLQGLDHCHSRGVLHRDIKCSDLLIDNNGILKIADFGLGTFYDPHKSHPLTSRVVTLWYRPPELLLGATKYGIAVDLWSTGCILAELYAGNPIMPGRTEAEQLHRIFKLCGSPSDKYWKKFPHAKNFKSLPPYKRQVSEIFKDFPAPALALIEILLSIDPADRGSAASALNSEFFTIMPHPCDPSSLPKYPPSKEFIPKVRERVRRSTAQSHGQKYDFEKRRSRESRAVAASETNAELISSMQLGKGPSRLNSGPLVAPSGLVDQMLKEHDSQLQAIVRRVHLDKGKMKTTDMGSIEEKVGFGSDEHVPFSASQSTNKIQSLNCETTHDLSHSKFSASWVLREVHRIRFLRSIYIVLIKAKINVLLPFGPLAIMLHYLTKKQEWVFFFSLIGITPLAERLGYATEQLAFYTGPTVGGLLNATFGNATEMIISIYALKNGMMRVVKQSLLGSILSNMLLVLGCAFFCGGIVHNKKVQKFNKAAALVNSGLLLMAVMGLLFPAMLHFTHTEIHQGKSEIALSRFSSCIMLIAYASYLFFQLKSQSSLYSSLDEATENNGEDSDEEEIPEISHWEAIGWLAVLTLWISVLSGYLVDAIQGASDSMNIPITFISVILLPIVGNAAEHASAIMFAMKDKLDITIGVAIGSSTQISMFVIPFCVIFGWILGKPMDLNFQLFETATLFITVLVVAFMLQEGQSNYFKGLMLTLCYLIVAASFFVHIDPSNDE